MPHSNSQDAEAQDPKTSFEKDSQVQFDEVWSNDTENPLNWSTQRKWTAVGVVSAYSLATPTSSVVMAPALELIAAKYHESNPTVIALSLSVYVVSIAIGPLVWAPLSEMYGRTSSLHVANMCTALFNLACAFSPTIDILIGMRLLTGFFASASMSIGAGTISDLFEPKERASATSIYSLGLLLGPSLGPIIGGFVSKSLDVKWIFIIMAIICAAFSIIGIPLLRETYGPVILKRRARKEGTLHLFFEKHPEFSNASHNKGRLLLVNLTRPTVLLFRSFILFMLALYMAYLFGLNYLLFASYPTLFRTTYGFDSGGVGLTYLGIGVGCILAAICSGKFGGQIYNHLSKKNGSEKPEYRVPALILGSLIVPIGLFWYGWSAASGIHWIMPIIGTGIFGFGMMTAWLPIQLYVLDTFKFAASASSTLSVFRSLLGFVFPLFSSQMFETLGVGPGISLLAGIAIVIGIPFPVWLYFKGEEVRKRNKHTR